ncbi:RhoGAP-domain-containing protein [Lichtheimia hyalospora FSU 10163]|nr:RhoGAP-domain-containing protein [Lichtheimia hyalospora FSU 10163]
MSQQQRQPGEHVSAEDELVHLRSQNEQLWKIVEKQRVMIQNLQKDNSRLAIERDGILDKYQALEKEMGMRTQRQRYTSILISPEMLREIAEADDATTPLEAPPVVPTIITSNLSTSSGGGAVATTPSSSGSSSPVPPPRSPFRRVPADDIRSVKNMETSPPTSPVPTEKARRRKARESMMPPPRTMLEHDPTMRAASPPLPRTGLSRSETPTMEQYHHPLAVPTIQEPPSQQHDNIEHAGMNLSVNEVYIKVTGSTIKTNERGKEVISFIIAIGRSEEPYFDELWRVEKRYSDFLDLDAKLKAQPNPEVTSRISKLPDKAMFTTHAPSKVDQRKLALEQYLQHALSLPWQDMSDLCEFLSTNVIEHDGYRKAIGMKEGYLTKRGKNFGGWKSRYFVLNGDVIDYFESKDGNQLGTIRLTNAQIGRQTSGVTPAADDNNSVYRHAFLLVEQKRAGSSNVVRHILCAESDQDRDEWVEAIIQNINFDNDPPASLVKENKRNKKDKPRKSSKGDVPMVKEPENVVGVAISSGVGPTPSVSSDSTDSSLLSSSLPSNAGMPPPPSAAWTTDYGRTSLDQQLPPHGRNLHTPPPILMRRSSMVNLSTTTEEAAAVPPPIPTTRAPSPSSGRTSEDILDETPDKKTKNKANRMTFWGKKMFSSSSSSSNNAENPPAPRTSSSLTTDAASTTTSTRASIAPSGFRSFLSRSSNESSDRHQKQAEGPSPKQVFGIPLEEAVRVSRVVEGYELPSVVYRCIEYLDAKNAVMEEGLYRLSGSSTVMKNLRQRFNREGDVNLLASKEEYDVHAIAGLLKMWLRELPTSVLTRERRSDFLHVIDLLDRKDRVNELGRLVSQLPLAHYTLLRALTAHLIRVVQHSDINKMTVRNVSIVFSPTLGVPAMIFNLFMSEFEYVFCTTEDGDAAPRMIEDEEEEQETTTTPSQDESQQQQPPASGLGRKSTLKLRDEYGRNNRNSISYVDGAPNAIVELERNMDGPPVLDEDDDEVDELTLSTSQPRPSEDDTASVKSERTDTPTPTNTSRIS